MSKTPNIIILKHVREDSGIRRFQGLEKMLPRTTDGLYIVHSGKCDLKECGEAYKKPPVIPHLMINFGTDVLEDESRWDFKFFGFDVCYQIEDSLSLETFDQQSVIQGNIKPQSKIQEYSFFGVPTDSIIAGFRLVSILEEFPKIHNGFSTDSKQARGFLRAYRKMRYQQEHTRRGRFLKTIKLAKALPPEASYFTRRIKKGTLVDIMGRVYTDSQDTMLQPGSSTYLVATNKEITPEEAREIITAKE